MLKPHQRGMTLIELMVGLAILAILLMSGAPSLSEWIRNSQIRSASESILTGLHHARAEAVKRNTPVRFQLTSTLENDCAVSASGKNWVVNMSSTTTPAASCAAPLDDTAEPFLLQKSVAANISSPITVTSSQAAVAFNGLGQQTATMNPNQAPAVMTINITPTSGACLADGGTTRCLRIVISPAGQARMCDPSLTGSTSVQPMAC